MTEFTKLLESTVLSEESKTAILEAWDTKLNEAREEIASELREEFATRYTHDKNLIIEASENFIREALSEEIKEFADDKKKVKEARVELEKIKEGFAAKAHAFISEAIKSEVKEFRDERKKVNESLGAMQSFMQKQLTEELTEFATDKKELAEARVSFEKNKNKELREAKARFVESATKVSQTLIQESLRAELTQLKTDLKESKSKMFGAKLFEAFAAEYYNSHLNEGSQLKKMGTMLESAREEIKSLTESAKKKDILLAEAKKDIEKQKTLKERADVMNKLLNPLNKSQRNVMQKLLESTATADLQKGYNKFISAVLNENSEDSSEKTVLAESTKSKVAYDGNRKEPASTATEDDTLTRLQKLSGIK